MDEKTEELRDIFVDVTDAETVTESQEETIGSLTGDEEVTERLDRVIDTMREDLSFDTDLEKEEYCRLVRAFYDGASDAEMARDLDVSRDTVFRARLDLHLFRDRDTDAPFDLSALRDALEADRAVSEIADELDVSPSTVRKYRRVVEAKGEARRANDRYRDEFESILGDAELSEHMTDEAQEDGLEDATEGMETDVSF